MQRNHKTLNLLAIFASLLTACGCASEAVDPSIQCTSKADCADGEACINNRCVVETNFCLDGKKGQNETDVDCGGGTCAACAAGKACKTNSDCQSANCVNDVCAESETPDKTGVSRGDVLIAEIMNNAQNNKPFDDSSSSQTEFFELVNKTDNVIDLTEFSIKCTRQDDGKNTNFTLPLSGEIAPHNAAVISHSLIQNLPEGVINPLNIASTGRLVNSATYQCDLLHTSDKDALIHRVWLLETSAGTSSVLEPLYYELSGTQLVEHTTVNARRHTPGYCTNGALYLNDCDTLCANNKLDDGETDIDCGGPLCNVCSEGKACKTASDCESTKCVNSICVAQDCLDVGCPDGEVCNRATGNCFSCIDHVQTGDETDIDCGGSCPTKCTEGQTCLVGTDCDSNQCVEGVCARQPCTVIGCSDGYRCNSVTGTCYACDDNIKNGNETDVDCGGSWCGACDAGQTCNTDSDCATNACDSKTKICVSCSDNIKNGKETDVDCGGACENKCFKGQTCSVNEDCSTTQCTNGICTGEDLRYATIGDILINEAYGKRGTSNANKTFTYNDGASVCEFVELVNLTDEDLRLNNLVLNFKRINADTDKINAVELTAIIRAKSATVAHSCESLPLPGDVTAVTLTSTAMLVDTAETYELYLTDSTDDEAEGPHAEIKVRDYTGISNNRATDADPSAAMIRHSEVSTSNGVLASPGYCANGGLFSENCLDPCANGRKDANETDIDCGGACGTCALGKRCSVNDDCTSKVCGNDVDASGYPILACISCSDKRKNGDETDVDCGGACGTCAKGKSCKLDRDCASFSCESNRCTKDDCLIPDSGSILITEVMGSPNTKDNFDTSKTGSDTKQNEFIELVNTTSSRLDLRQVTVNYIKSDTISAASVSLESHIGCLDAHQALVVSNFDFDSASDLPSGVQYLHVMSTAITNTSQYDVYLLSDGKEIDRVVRAANNKNGISQARNPWNDESATTLVLHNTIDDIVFKNSPGYCSNGGLYVNQCK